MSIKNIEAEELREMAGKEGLILQDCGGPLQDWLDGINNMLTEAGILQNGSRFTDIYVFEHEGLTNLLFPFENAKLDVGKLAMWRLQTFGNFSGKWLTDYVDNRLGGFIDESRFATDKPDCPLIGADGNVFNLIGIASRTQKTRLRRSGKGNDLPSFRVRQLQRGIEYYRRICQYYRRRTRPRVSPFRCEENQRNKG